MIDLISHFSDQNEFNRREFVDDSKVEQKFGGRLVRRSTKESVLGFLCNRVYGIVFVGFRLLLVYAAIHFHFEPASSFAYMDGA